MLSEWISRELLIPIPFIEGMAASASHRYRVYEISGRAGPKMVYHPSRQLKSLQRWLLRRVISLLAVHTAAMAYEKDRGIRKNSEQHRHSRFLLRMDFRRFFPSLTDSDVKTVLQRAKAAGRITSSWTDDDSSLLAQIVCRNRRLTIGAPTSPNLANAICFELDENLTALAARYGATYTRYADDLFFSTTRPNVLLTIELQVRDIVANTTFPEKLQLNHSKTRHTSTRGRRVITGIVLTPDGQLSLGRKLKRRIRSQVHNVSKLKTSDRNKLRGWLAYCKSIEPDFINRLILKLGPATVEAAMKG